MVFIFSFTLLHNKQFILLSAIEYPFIKPYTSTYFKSDLFNSKKITDGQKMVPGMH
jgi:hypothetical protein